MTQQTLPGVAAPPKHPEDAVFKTLVRDHRRAKQMTIQMLAKAVGISSQYLSEIELGQKLPTAEVTAKLCDALDIPDAEWAYWALAADWGRVPESWQEEVKRLRWFIDFAGGKADG